MDHPIWLLVPWLVFSAGIGLKVWKVSNLLRRRVRNSSGGIERFRADLERRWQRSQSPR
jgi:hypothetical protein